MEFPSSRLMVQRFESLSLLPDSLSKDQDTGLPEFKYFLCLSSPPASRLEHFPTRFLLLRFFHFNILFNFCTFLKINVNCGRRASIRFNILYAQLMDGYNL